MSRRTRLRGAVLVTVAVVLQLLAMSTSQAAGTGSIAGRVTDSSGQPIASALVTVRDAQGSSFKTTAETDADGNYEATGLVPSVYGVTFDPPAGSDDYIAEKWNDDPYYADPVPVAEGQRVSGIDAALSWTAKISGRVTDRLGIGVPFATVYPYEKLQDGYFYPNYPLEEFVTDAQGNYSMVLPPGTYRLRFDRPLYDYAATFWRGALTLDDGENIVLEDETRVSGVNVQLAKASHITGSVSSEYEATSVEGLQVVAHRRIGTEWVEMGTGVVIEDGRVPEYDIGGLPAGTYRLEFRDSRFFVGEWWNNAPSLESADNIVVGEGSTVGGKNAVVNEKSRVTGRVTDPQGRGIPNVAVFLTSFFDFIPDGTARGSTRTNERGYYSIGLLEPGIYRLGFNTSESTRQPYVAKYWRDAANFSDATDIVVGQSEVVTGMNAVLTPTGVMSGTVSDGDGHPVDGISVVAYRYLDGEWDYETAMGTSGGGRYAFDQLQPGK